MTSTLLQPTATTTTTAAAIATKSRKMGWSNEKLRFTCVDNIGLKQLWRLVAASATHTTPATAAAAATTTTNKNHINNVALQQHNNNNNNNNNNNEKMDFGNRENLGAYLTQRDFAAPSRMSLLKFLAINALELSAPATPALLQQQQQQQQCKQLAEPQGWMQLSGHPESFVPTSSGVVRKRVSGVGDNEVLAYRQISQELQTAKIVPHFYGTLQSERGENFIELQDLLQGFKDPCVMDIKMGCRTFLESEVSNKTLRPDLYQKMVAIDKDAPTAAEHEAQAITKLRYMLFRESMSSSHTKGFRIEALRLRGRAPVKDLKTVRSTEHIAQTIEQFMGGRRSIQKELIKRLKHMRTVMEHSAFFQRHEVVGSSIFIVYDDDHVGAWLIDFAKSRPLPDGLQVTHRNDWTPGNREEGLLKGMDELIDAFERVYAQQGVARRCLQI